MSDKIYIKDDFGNQIPLLDEYGNLSVEVIMLYTEDKLTTADRKAVDDFAATDEMSKDALEGFLLTSNSSKTRHQLGQVNTEIQKASGAKAMSSFAPPKKEFDYKKLAAAIALLFTVTGGTFFAAQFFDNDELADVAKEEKEISSEVETVSKIKEASIKEQDSLIESIQANTAEETEKSVEIEQPKTELDKKRSGSTKENDSPAANFLYDDILEQVALEEKSTPQVSNDLSDDETIVDADISDTENAEQEEAERMQDDLANYELLAKAQQKDKAEEAKRQGNIQSQSDAMAEGVAQVASEQVRESEIQRAAPVVESLNRKESYDELSREETPARFPGGDLEMYKFIENNKQYTDEMENQGLRGAILVSFQITKEGTIERAKIESGKDELLRKDALRVIQSMPKWEPAKKENGKAVKSTKVVVIKYE